jgi:predicted ATPase
MYGKDPMIRSLRAENFKPWRDTGALELAPLTGLFGANSSGKTSILQMLLMLKQTVESPDRKQVLRTGDEYSLVDLGTFSDLIHGHRSDTTLKLEISWDLPEPLKVYDPERERTPLYTIPRLSFTTSIREEERRPVVESFSYSFDDHHFGMVRRDGYQKREKDEYDLCPGDYPARRVAGRAWPLPAPVKCYSFPDEATGYFQNTGFLPDLVLAFEKLFSRVAYLRPLRDDPQRTYVWAGERPVDVGEWGEKAVAALLAARTDKRTSGRGPGKARRYKPVEERILEWLRKMGLIYSFAVREVAPNRKDYEFRARKSRSSPEVLITDVGFGVSQIFPVLVLCYYVPEGTTVILEQPEIHLHPAVQASLADVLIDVVKERNLQIIVESHSEHLLRRLQRRIAEEKISPADTALYFCRFEHEESIAERLEVDAFGNIRNWPDDFFGDEIGELAKMTEAAMNRQEPVNR